MMMMMLFKFMTMKMTFVMMKIMIFQIWTPPNQLGVNFEKAESGKFANLLLCSRYGWKIGRNRKNPTLCLFLWWQIIFFQLPLLRFASDAEKHITRNIDYSFSIFRNWFLLELFYKVEITFFQYQWKLRKKTQVLFKCRLGGPPPTHTDIPTVIVKTSNKLWNQMKMKMKQRRSWN